LAIELADGQRFACELVILSTGIRANTALVENLDIAVSKLKGIHVNDKLQTSAQNIYAIGECALFEQQPCELLASGYRMAEVLAGRFNGHSQLVYVKPQNVTRLKMPAQSVISIGDIDAELPSIEYACEGAYRKIFYQQGLIVGAIGVGQWDEADQTQLAVANQYKLRQRQLKSFAKCGLLWPNVNPLKLWDDTTVICQCMGVSKGSLVTQVKQGCNTLPALANATQATTSCGSCKPLVQKFCIERRKALHQRLFMFDRRNWSPRMLLIIAAVAMVLMGLILQLPLLWQAQDYQGWRYQLTRVLTSFEVRQVSGYSILTMMLLISTMSARKRFERFNLGKMTTWRQYHGWLAVVALVLLGFHSGFSTGNNLSFYLLMTFIAANVLGCLNGLACASESFKFGWWSDFCRKHRTAITYAHIVTIWPLPILLAFHIIQAYYF
jgi:nitrite reductase (NADH) large subunit